MAIILFYFFCSSFQVSIVFHFLSMVIYFIGFFLLGLSWKWEGFLWFFGTTFSKRFHIFIDFRHLTLQHLQHFLQNPLSMGFWLCYLNYHPFPSAKWFFCSDEDLFIDSIASTNYQPTLHSPSWTPTLSSLVYHSFLSNWSWWSAFTWY